MTENASPAPQVPTGPGGSVPRPGGYVPGSGGYPPQGYPVAPALPQYGAPGPLGTPRGTGFGILLFLVTFGIYGWYWYFVVHDEMKRHTGTGIGGPVGLVLAVLVGVASPFIASAEVGAMYERSGQPKPVSAVTGLWAILGLLILVGPIVWFVKTNGALNRYWRARGAQ